MSRDSRLKRFVVFLKEEWKWWVIPIIVAVILTIVLMSRSPEKHYQPYEYHIDTS